MEQLGSCVTGNPWLKWPSFPEASSFPTTADTSFSPPVGVSSTLTQNPISTTQPKSRVEEEVGRGWGSIATTNYESVPHLGDFLDIFARKEFICALKRGQYRPHMLYDSALGKRRNKQLILTKSIGSIPPAIIHLGVWSGKGWKCIVNLGERSKITLLAWPSTNCRLSRTYTSIKSVLPPTKRKCIMLMNTEQR